MRASFIFAGVVLLACFALSQQPVTSAKTGESKQTGDAALKEMLGED